MQVIAETIRKHRKKGDSYRAIIDKWSDCSFFKKKRLSKTEQATIGLMRLSMNCTKRFLSVSLAKRSLRKTVSCSSWMGNLERQRQ